MALFDAFELLNTIGLAGLFVIIFAESGLLIGFFLPGDSLLFTAGFLASQGYLNIWMVTAICFVAAVLGDNVGYAFGKRVGPRIFKKETSLLFNPKNLEHASRFYEVHGGKTLILARFLPVVRTFAPILAGVGAMRYPVFFAYNCLGAGLWAVGLPFGGYFLGSAIPGVDKYIIPIVFVIIVVSILPGGAQFLREYVRYRRKNKNS